VGFTTRLVVLTLISSKIDTKNNYGVLILYVIIQELYNIPLYNNTSFNTILSTINT